MLPRPLERFARGHPLQRVGAGVEDDRVPRCRGDRLRVLRDAAAPEVRPRIVGGTVHGCLDVGLRDQALHLPGLEQAVVKASAPTDVVVLEVDHGQLRVSPVQPVPLAIGGQDAVLRHPVQLAVQRERVVLDAGQDGLPPLQDIGVLSRRFGLLDVLLGVVQVLPLQLKRACPPAVPQADGLPARDVPGDVVERRHRLLQGQVGQEVVLDQLQHEGGGPRLEQRRHLAHVGVADDDVEPPVLLRIGVRLVARVDDGPLQRGLQAHLGLEEVGSLGQLVADAAALRPRALGPNLPRAGEHLAAHEERRQVTDDAGERCGPVHQVVLVAAVRVPLAVGVVLVDGQAVARREDPLDLPQRALQDALPGLVVDHQRARVGALRRGVLGVRMVDVVAGAVRQDHVGQPEVLLGSLPGLHRLEPPRVPQGRLLLVVPPDPAERPRVGVDQQGRREDGVELRRARSGDPVLRLDAHDLGNRHKRRVLPGTTGTGRR